MCGPYYGKYRGTIVEARDPLQLGRVQVTVPAFGEGPLSAWALPCVPYAGVQVGFLALPPVGANVWVEFEGGKIDSPIWSGCFWGAAELPRDASIAPVTKVLATDFARIVITDGGAEAGIEITTQDGASLAITPLGIVLDNGKGASIAMNGPTVSINGGALEVT